MLWTYSELPPPVQGQTKAMRQISIEIHLVSFISSYFDLFCHFTFRLSVIEIVSWFVTVLSSVASWRLMNASQKWVTPEHLCKTLELNPCKLKWDVIFREDRVNAAPDFELHCVNIFKIICLNCSLIPPVISILAALLSSFDLESSAFVHLIGLLF